MILVLGLEECDVGACLGHSMFILSLRVRYLEASIFRPNIAILPPIVGGSVEQCKQQFKPEQQNTRKKNRLKNGTT